MLRSFREYRNLLLIAGVSLSGLLFSCSSDPGDSGSGGGIGGSGVVLDASDVVVAEVTGFGSVFLNGRRFSTDQATFSINRQPGMESDLRIGMSVFAEVNLQTGIAASLQYRPIVIGPIAALNNGGREFTLLGQSVLLDDDTVLENVAVSSLEVGSVVEVSGIREANNRIVASFVRAADAATVYLLEGIVDVNQGGAGSISINGSSIGVSSIGGGSVANAISGDRVVVTVPAGSVDLTAAEINATALDSAPVFSLNVGGRIIIDGYVTDNTLGTILTVNEITVIVGADTVITFADGRPATGSSIGTNSRVEVTATSTGINLIVADEIVILE